MSSEPQRGVDREVPLFTDPGDVLLSMQAVVGRKWQPVIVYHLLEAEPLGFSALKERTDGISSKMLSESLDNLEAAGLVAREVVSDKPVRVEYALTEEGKSLEGLVREMVSWGSRHIDDPAGEDTGLVLEGAR
jgi:DNA-binding HxlR family transcriptional regulator